MQVNILDKKENRLLNRKEIEFNVTGSGVTPSRKELRAKIAALMDSKEQLIVVDKLKHGFGSTTVTGTARIYSNVAALKRLEPRYLIARNEGRKEKRGKQREEEKEAAAEEAPKEESEGKTTQKEESEEKE